MVVMTTEVLRNMLYAGSPTLSGLAYVVLDEVHYLADRFRGAVWEEVIIHLPDSVRVVALSATVSNAEEFGDWLAQVRGGTTVIVDEHRPVPLWQHMLAGGRLYDLFLESGPGRPPRGRPRDAGGAPGDPGPADQRRAQVNPELLRLARRDDWAARKAPSRPARGARRPVRFRAPRRPDVIDRLDRAGLLPAITFIFSRAGCEAAVRQCLDAGVRLTTPDEVAVITEIAERRTRDIPQADLPVLGYGEWLTGLQRGIAAHHAGMLPTFKEVVEELFEAGLVRAVFATETLALGINMPARHGGRGAAGQVERRDPRGPDPGGVHAAHWPGGPPGHRRGGTRRGALAARRGPAGRGRAGGHPHLPAQLQLPALLQHGGEPGRPGGPGQGGRAAGVVVRPVPGGPGGGRHRAAGPPQPGRPGRARPVLRPRELRRVPRAAPGTGRPGGGRVPGTLGGPLGAGPPVAGAAAPRRHHPGPRRPPGGPRGCPGSRPDQPPVPQRRSPAPGPPRLGPPGRSGEGPRDSGHGRVAAPPGANDPLPLVLTSNRQVKRLSQADFPVPVTPIDRMRIPNSFSARSPQHRRDLASTMRNKVAGRDLGRHPRSRRAAGGARPPRAGGDDITRLRRELRQHPCHGCPDREAHARQAEQRTRLEREVAGLESRVAARSHVIARTFDRVCSVLQHLGYLDEGAVTPDGRRLADLYTELDLLAAECLRRGLWEGLDPAELAACVSVLTFESRQADDDAAPRMPGGPVRDVVASMISVWGGAGRGREGQPAVVPARTRAGLRVGRARLGAGQAAGDRAPHGPDPR